MKTQYIPAGWTGLTLSLKLLPTEESARMGFLLNDNFSMNP